jgi:hypothetical protein
VEELSWIGWVIAFVSLVAGFVYFWLNRKIKRIEWWVDSDQSLINFPGASQFSGRVSVLVDKERLEEPRAVQVTIKNTGNVGLRTGNMYRPFGFVCEDQRRICAAEINRVFARKDGSEAVDVVFDSDERMVSLAPTLLNSGDSLNCRLLVDGKRGSVHVEGEAEDFIIQRTERREPINAGSWLDRWDQRSPKVFLLLAILVFMMLLVNAIAAELVRR